MKASLHKRGTHLGTRIAWLNASGIIRRRHHLSQNSLPEIYLSLAENYLSAFVLDSISSNAILFLFKGRIEKETLGATDVPPSRRCQADIQPRVRATVQPPLGGSAWFFGFENREISVMIFPPLVRSSWGTCGTPRYSPRQATALGHSYPSPNSCRRPPDFKDVTGTSVTYADLSLQQNLTTPIAVFHKRSNTRLPGRYQRFSLTQEKICSWLLPPPNE